MSRRAGPLVKGLERGTRLWRGHDLSSSAVAYNPTGAATRFTPVTGAGGTTLPYMYLGESDEVAIAETALHDVTGRTRRILEAKLLTLALSELEVTRTLTLIDLTGLGLTRIGRNLSTLIATVRYDKTSAAAQELVDSSPNADGIIYPSRMFATGRAIVLYQREGRRAPLRRRATLACGAGEGRARVDAACSAANVTVVR